MWQDANISEDHAASDFRLNILGLFFNPVNIYILILST